MTDVTATQEADPRVAKLAEWFKLKARIAAECAPLIEQERAMRAELFSSFFPAPKEGTNTHVLPDGFQVKGTYPIERKVDAEVIATLRGLRLVDLPADMLAQLHIDPAAFGSGTLVVEALRLNVDSVVEYEPKLKVKEYRTLTAEQQAIFDRCLTSKPGSISLTVTEPAKRGGKAGDNAPAAAGFN